MSDERKTIHEQLENFKKYLWSNEKPMDFATNVVEELLLEIQRQQTIMRAGLDEIDRHWTTHTEGENMNDGQLYNLMENLRGNRRGFYSQYLSPNEYREFIARQTNFEAFAKAQEVAFAEQDKIKEKESGDD